MANVVFRRGSFDEFKRITSPDLNTLYVIEDLGKIYKGRFDITKAVQLVSNDEFEDLVEGPVTDVSTGMFYLNTETLQILVRNIYETNGTAHDEVIVIYPGIDTTSAFNVNAGIVTGEQVADYVEPLIEEIKEIITIKPMSSVSNQNTILVFSEDSEQPVGDSGYSIGTDVLGNSSTTLATEKGVSDAIEEATSKWTELV